MVVADPGQFPDGGDNPQDIRGMGHGNEPGGRGDDRFEGGHIKRVIRPDANQVEPDTPGLQVPPWQEV